MQYSPASCDFIPPRSNYSPQHPVLRHPHCQTVQSKTPNIKTWKIRQNPFSVSPLYIFRLYRCLLRAVCPAHLTLIDFIALIIIIIDRLCGLVVSVADYKHRGPGFDSRALLRIFLRLGLERGPLSLVIG
jgi:hypothetical protein